MFALHGDGPARHADLQLVRSVLCRVQTHLHLLLVLLDPDDLGVLLLEEVEVLEAGAEAGQHPPPGEHPAVLVLGQGVLTVQAAVLRVAGLCHGLGAAGAGISNGLRAAGAGVSHGLGAGVSHGIGAAGAGISHFLGAGAEAGVLQHDVIGHAGHLPEVLVEPLPHVPGLPEHLLPHSVKVVPGGLEERVVEEEVSHGHGNSALSHV